MFSSPQMIYVSRDPERLQAFYESLGFRPGFRTPAEGPADHADVVLDGFRLGLVRAAAAQRVCWIADPDGHPVQLVQRRQSTVD